MTRVPFSSLALLLLVGACDPASSVQPSFGELLVGVRESHGPGNVQIGDPDVMLFLETEREFGCANFRIDARTTVEGRFITVRVDGIIEPTICLTAMGPARYRVKVPVTIGQYVLRVELRGLTDEYLLTATTAALDLARERGRFTRPQLGRALRYPQRSFAVICDARAGDRGWCDEFHAALLADPSFSQFEFGAGEIPYPTGWTVLGGPDWRATYFRYSVEADFARAGAIVRTLAERHPGVWVYILNWRNEAHRSWPVPGL